MKPMIAPFSTTLRCARQVSRSPLAAIILALAAGLSVPAAAANDSFAEAIDLGVATEWEASGTEFVGTIEERKA